MTGAKLYWDLRHSGGQLLEGLPTLAFLHETAHGWSGGFMTPGVSPYQHVLDTVDATLATLDELEAFAVRRRRNPLYWGDRLLGALLGFPAYVLGLILGVPRSRIDESPIGTALRVLALIVEVGLLVVGLREAGWF